MAAEEKLDGVVENVVYYNEDTYYAVVELLTDDGTLATAVGQIAFPAEGERLILAGNWTRHAEYGRQFSVLAYEKKMPEEEDAILRYLSSRVIRGIGPVTAKRLVERYGKTTFDVIENHPEWLTGISGISATRAAEIHKSFAEQSGVRMLIMLCRDYISPAVLTRVYEKWGSNAAELIKRDPYCLCEIPGAGFDKVDALAAGMGVGQDSVSRIGGGMRYLLEYNAAVNGHTCLPASKLIEASAAHLQLAPARLSEALEQLVAQGTLRSFRDGDGTVLYGTERLMRGEEYIASKLRLLDEGCSPFSISDVDAMVAPLEKAWHITYADEQYEAIRQALRRGVLLVTGGPGTGKTTVIRALLQLFDSLGMKVALAAPTGRAAKRMSEATGTEAKTLHRLLEMERAEGTEAHFNRDARNPLDENVLIVDEASMIDVPLMEATLRAMRKGSRLLLIGDADQLPSVGAGNVLCDLLMGGAFATVRLTHIYRQEDESLIVTNAHRINRGEEPELSRHDRDFFFLPCGEEDVPATVADLVTRRLPNAYGKEFASGIQVITPSRKGRAGTEALNVLLQKVCNPPSKSKKEQIVRDLPFREGDRVMQIRNNYDVAWEKYGVEGTGVFNGDIGVIEAILPREEQMQVKYDDDRVAVYEGSVSEELEHAYAITVHKSQGSEYPCVIVPVCSCPPLLMTRNLLYTAVTRARRMVILVGRREILRAMVENDRQVLRYTTLKDRVRRDAAVG